MHRHTAHPTASLWRLSFAALVAVVLLAACGSSDDEAGDAVGNTTDNPAVTSEAPAGAATDLPDVAVEDLAGGDVALSSLVGDKPLLVWFWAPW